MRRWIFVCVSLISAALAESCGNNKLPYGIEVHRDGRVVLLCTRPQCFNKKYAECDERPLRTSGCASNSTWVGGVQRTIDSSQIYVQCCDYPFLADYSELVYKKVVVRRGEFFEGEEKENSDGEVTTVDLITNISISKDEKGEFYAVEIKRFYCDKVPDQDPAWQISNPWPFFTPQH